MKSSTITWIVLAILGIFLAYGCYLILRPFLSEIFLALVLAIVIYPAYSWLEQKTNRPTLTAWICTLGTGILFLLPITVLGVVISQEMKLVMDKLNASIGPSGSFEWFDRSIAFISQQLGWDPSQTKEFLQTRLSLISSSVLSNAVKSLQGIGSWLFSTIITLVTMFFLFRGGRSAVEQSKAWIPLPARVIEGLYADTRKLMFANVYGVIAVALAQGGLTTVGFWITGLPSAVFWGTLAALLSILPFIGAGLIWFPAVIYLAATGHWTQAGILLVWGLLIVSMADNVIRPIVLSEGAQMNTAIMFFALLGGIDAFGLIGIFAGPIVFSLAAAVLKLLRVYSAAAAAKLEPESAVL